MDSEEVIWIVVAVVVVLALVALAVALAKRRRRRDEEHRRLRAAELRTEADQHGRVLPEAELEAREQRLEAERLRVEAERARERAEEAETGYLQQAAQREDRLREAERIDPDGGGGAHRRDA